MFWVYIKSDSHISGEINPHHDVSSSQKCYCVSHIIWNNSDKKPNTRQIKILTRKKFKIKTNFERVIISEPRNAPNAKTEPKRPNNVAFTSKTLQAISAEVICMSPPTIALIETIPIGIKTLGLF